MRVCALGVLSEVDSVHSGGSFPFLHEGRVFLHGAGVALRVNKIGWGSSYIGRSIVAVD